MKAIIAIYFCVTVPLSAFAQDPYLKKANPNWVDQSAIEKKLAWLNEDYADVPSAVDCKKQSARHRAPVGFSDETGPIICNNEYLRQAELLNTRAAAYAIENGTHERINHKQFNGRLPSMCTTPQCVYESFVDDTNSSLGGESPYYK